MSQKRGRKHAATGPGTGAIFAGLLIRANEGIKVYFIPPVHPVKAAKTWTQTIPFSNKYSQQQALHGNVLSNTTHNAVMSFISVLPLPWPSTLETLQWSSWSLLCPSSVHSYYMLTLRGCRLKDGWTAEAPIFHRCGWNLLFITNGIPSPFGFTKSEISVDRDISSFMSFPAYCNQHSVPLLLSHFYNYHSPPLTFLPTVVSYLVGCFCITI